MNEDVIQEERSRRPDRSAWHPSAWILGLIRLYQRTLSPMLGARCRYLPSCSRYGHTAIETHGMWRGGWLAMKRVGRCHPWGGQGYDPVPGTEGPVDGHETSHETRNDASGGVS